jgi:DNA repair exonuclease SbcCD ATPase subunit
MIIFEKIRWKNLLSTGAHFTEVSFTKSTNTLIIGQNGAGKSTILDALCFVLFGKPFRKINKPQLLNSINLKDCLVELDLTIGKKKYKIVRGMKPNKFEIHCDGVLLNQDAAAKDYQEVLEDQILKLNYKSFTQVVILGSASFVPFMQLPSGDRRAIIEELLDIQIFSTMNSVVKDKMTVLKDGLSKAKFDINLTQEKIALQQQLIAEHKKHNSDEIEKRQAEIGKSKDQSEQLLADIALINKHIEQMNLRVGNKKSVLDQKSKGLFQIKGKIESKISANKQEIAFYENNHDCPTCKQAITDEWKTLQVTEKTTKIVTQEKGLQEIEDALAAVNKDMSELTLLLNHIVEHNTEISKHYATINAIENYIKKMQNEIDELSVKVEESENGNDKLTALTAELEEHNTTYGTLLTDKQYLEYASILLKDTGIKTKIIKQYLPIMNKLINKYLSAMNFFVNFNINENFEETIKSRHRDDFSYANFSEGEKLRIDLALLFTWRQIAKLKNSTNTNLLILDEVFDSSMDTVGTEEFLKLINEMGTDTNVFVISHKGDVLFDKFRSVIKFSKKGNFSRIEKS